MGAAQSVEDVAKMARSLGSAYAKYNLPEIVQANSIDAELLASMNESDVKDLVAEISGLHLRKLLMLIAKVSEDPQKELPTEKTPAEEPRTDIKSLHNADFHFFVSTYSARPS